MGAGENGKVVTNLGLGMGMNHWEWEGMRLKKTFPLISTSVSFSMHVNSRISSHIVNDIRYETNRTIRL